MTISFSDWFSDQKPTAEIPAVGTDEGATCNRDGCKGVMQYVRAGDCSCHISPPCLACTEAALLCNACDADPEDEEAGK